MSERKTITSKLRSAIAGERENGYACVSLGRPHGAGALAAIDAALA
jgi:hypothetical protein